MTLSVHPRRARVALVQRFVPHYNLVFYRRLLASSSHEWEFIYGSYPGRGESGLATQASEVLPTRDITNIQIGSAVWQKGIARWLREQRYDAVVFELGWQIVSNPWLVYAAHRSGAVAIPWTKGIAESGQPRPRWRKWLEKLFIGRCDTLLVYGQVSANYFTDYGFPRERIFVAQNTVDVRRIVETVPESRIRGLQLRNNLHLTDEVIIGYLGRLVSQKQVDRIIEAFCRVHAAGLKARLVIAGDGPERQALEGQARRSGASAAIHFCGRVSEEDIGGYFQLFDVFVSAFSAGLAILEAMAHGKIPLITPELRPETELVVQGVTGVITADYSVESLADGMLEAAGYVHGGNSVGQAAQAAVLAQATTEKMVEAFDQAINCALGKTST
jgi:glycosyltransferase involved in cell wall biosynthesis